MAITLALVEATAVFAAVYATLMLWARPLLADWTESAGLLAQATAFSLCYIVACYFSGLYDLRNLRRFSDLLARLTRCISILVIVMVPVSSSIPRTWMGMEPFAASLLNTIALLLVLRAAAYWALLRRSFSERVLIVGTGPLAQNLIQEMKARPRCPYAIIGVVDDGMAPGRPPFRVPTR